MKSANKSLVTIGLGLLVLAAGYFGVYGQWNKLAVAREVHNVAKVENERLVKAHQDSSVFLASFENNREIAQVAQRALPMDKPQVPWLLENVSKLVKESGLNLIEMNIEEGATEVEPQPNSIQSVDIDLSLSGTYASYKELLLRIQRNLRIMDQVSLSISTDEENSGGQFLRYQLKLKAYYQP